MPAHSDEFPWPSYYGHFNVLENIIQSHDKVRKLLSEGDGVYELILHNGRSFRLFICECYSFGVAEYEESIINLGELSIIIINSNWCSYTDDAKMYCRQKKVGLFNIKDFMGALNMHSYWLYLSDYDKERYKKKGLL